MNRNVAQAALAFLDRVQLTGQEVEAFQAVRQALTEVVNWEPPAEQVKATVTEIPIEHDMKLK